MNRYNLTAALLIIFVSACVPSTTEDKKSTEWKPAAAGNFTIRVPSHMKESTELHEDAILQFQNPIKEFYCIVIQESQQVCHGAVVDANLQDEYSPNLNGYSRLVSDRFSENVDELISKSEFKPIMIDGDSAIYFEAEAKVSGIKAYYHYGFIKGDTTYYQVMSWTLLGKKEKLRADMVEILSSFKEK